MSAGYVNIPGSLSFSKRGELVYYTLSGCLISRVCFQLEFKIERYG